MQTGLIRPEDLSRKYTQELFANEIVLLSYYIAAVNIESVYRELCAEHGVEPVAEGFPGISLTDTFAMDERDSQLAGGVFPGNTARLEKQRNTKIDVIVMNPPYRAGQASANDGSQNAKYPKVDAAIKASYVERSTATLKNGLYDSYYRALRWATDRLDGDGVIAFVSNSGFIDGGTAAGVRLSWADEFSEIIVYNLRGNMRVRNWQAEGGQIFGAGSQAGIAIAVLIKRSGHVGPARIHYADIGDYLSREEKLDKLVSEQSVEATQFALVTPNAAGDWINHRDERFGAYQPIGDKASKGRASTPAVFTDYSNGLKTNRDAWTSNFSGAALRANVQTHVQHLNEERERIFNLIEEGARMSTDELLVRDGSKGTWDRVNLTDLRRNRPTIFDGAGFRLGQYRPFVRMPVYFDRSQRLNNCTYQLPRIWPTANHANLAIAVSTDGRVDTGPILTSQLADLGLNATAQLFPRFAWEPTAVTDGALNLEALAEASDDVVVDGYRRVDNITDATLEAYRAAHGDEITKDDIFYGIYALLHHPTYRETYAADLQKMLPRIPQVKDFVEYARIGRALAELHVDYESVEPYPLGEETAIDVPDDPYELYRIDKPAWVSRKDRTAIRYNAHLTITGIPESEADYKVGGRSPLEWVIDRYRVTVDKASGIVNDPNAWLREHDDPRYVVDLIASLVTVSLETQRLVAELPEFEVIEDMESIESVQQGSSQ